MTKKAKSAPKGHHDYISDCPDCMPLPTAFPTSCLGPVTMALRGQIDDPQCVLHCALTLTAWAAGLWIHEGHPPLRGEAKEATMETAAAELDKLQPKTVGASASDARKEAVGINWRLVVQMILQLISQLVDEV